MTLKERLDALRVRFASRRVAYRLLFSGPNGKVVLEDLARFCRANESAFHPDARKHAVAEGRREVWLHLQEYLQLTDAELWQLAKPREAELVE